MPVHVYIISSFFIKKEILKRRCEGETLKILWEQNRPQKVRFSVLDRSLKERYSIALKSKKNAIKLSNYE